MALTTDECKDRPPINFAKLGEGGLRFLFVAFRVRARQNDTPPRRYEAIRAALSIVNHPGFYRVPTILFTAIRRQAFKCDLDVRLPAVLTDRGLCLFFIRYLQFNIEHSSGASSQMFCEHRETKFSESLKTWKGPRITRLRQLAFG